MMTGSCSSGCAKRRTLVPLISTGNTQASREYKRTVYILESAPAKSDAECGTRSLGLPRRRRPSGSASRPASLPSLSHFSGLNHDTLVYTILLRKTTAYCSSLGMNGRTGATGESIASALKRLPWFLRIPITCPFSDREVEGESRWQTLGMVGGRILLVAHTVEMENDEEIIRIVSARKATPRERSIYAEGK